MILEQSISTLHNTNKMFKFAVCHRAIDSDQIQEKTSSTFYGM